jgi:hypothetical protein
MNESPEIAMDLPRGNRIHIQLRHKVTAEELPILERIFALAPLALTEIAPQPPEIDEVWRAAAAMKEGIPFRMSERLAKEFSEFCQAQNTRPA